ncbi:glycosyltransferase family 2 protein [Candidatus Pelagibacter sp.]|jgi:dolichol-phosphate mannosyltransferase|nr:glycosyltransferase family 2 protein [Candidatus Pelagibacter sp.]
MKLSIIIPCYNEKNTIEKIVNQLNSLKIKKQIILVDDKSNDGTTQLIKRISKKLDRVIFHKKNLGKGGAIKSAKKFINGDYVVIQDADLEYDPKNLITMFNLMIKKKYDVLYGSRVLGSNRYVNNENFTSLFRVFANHALTVFSNIVNKQKLTDAHTCYKMFKKEIFNKISLKENGFSFCPEINTKVSNLDIIIHEVPINYKGRSYQEGKKISFSDGIKALYTVIKYSSNK